jgi:hypothetical protein
MEATGETIPNAGSIRAETSSCAAWASIGASGPNFGVFRHPDELFRLPDYGGRNLQLATASFPKDCFTSP